MRIQLLALLSCLLFLNKLDAKESSPAPNVLIIVMDDLGWNDVGYRNPKVVTPNIDRLAKTSVRLDRHYVCTTCSPTRCALLTGRFPSRFGILGPIAGKSKLALPKEMLTLPRLLSRQGYDTAISGKWHLGLRPEVGPTQYGFDSSYGYLHGQIDPIEHLYKFGDKTWHRNDKFIEEKGHVTDLINDEAVRFIKQKRSKPFFLYVAHHSPHTPFVEEDKWINLYKDSVTEPSRRLYLASISHVDEGIGRIVQALDETGQRENTLILFTSDNGGQRNGGHSPKQYEGKFGPYPVLSDNTPLRGWKGDLYEGGIRVPAFVSWPKQLKPSQTSRTIHAVDWLPTIAKLLGATLPSEAKLDGQNVWPLNSSDQEEDRVLYWKTGRESAVRQAEWKLLVRKGNNQKAELYNVVKDPSEKSNLADQQSAKTERLLKILSQQQRLDR